MKREYLIGITLAIIGAALVAYFLFNDRDANSNGQSANVNTNDFSVNDNAVANDSGPDTMTLNADTISQHDSVDDCWLVISGVVYDVTSYLPGHPRGAGLVTPYCGVADATEAFATKGDIGVDHSAMAYDELADYRLGDLNDTIEIY